MEKNEVLDIIISFIKACKKDKEHAYIECDGKRIWSANYLLNQILRQYYKNSLQRRRSFDIKLI